MTDQPRIERPSRYAVEKMCYDQRKTIKALEAEVEELKKRNLYLQNRVSKIEIENAGLYDKKQHNEDAFAALAELECHMARLLLKDYRADEFKKVAGLVKCIYRALGPKWC